MTPEEIQALIARHGGLASAPVATNPTIKDNDPTHTGQNGQPNTYGIEVPNPNPIYRYILKDGTYFEASSPDNGTTFQITSPGNALAARSTAGPATPPDQWVPIKDDAGRTIAMADPKDPTHRVSVPNTPADRNAAAGATKQTYEAGRIFTWVADGAGNWNIQAIGDPLESSAKPKEGDKRQNVSSGYAVQEIYQGGQWVTDPSVPPRPWSPELVGKPKEGDTRQNVRDGYEVRERYSGGQWVTDPSFTPRPFDPSLAGKPRDGDTRQNVSGGYEIREVYRGGQWVTDPTFTPKPFDPTLANKPKEGDTRQNVVQGQVVTQVYRGGEWTIDPTAAPRPFSPPAAVQRAQELYDSVEFIRGEVAAGRITPAEGEQYKNALQQNFDAALQGTTPYQQYQDKLARQQQRLQEGRSLLNQRVQSGSGLAEALLSSAVGMAGKIRDPSAFIGFTPFAGAFDYVTELGGGPDVYTSAADAVKRGLAPDPASAMLQAALSAPSGGGGNAGGGGNGSTQPQPVAANWQRADQPITGNGPGLAAPGLTGTVPPGDPRYLGTLADPAAALLQAALAQQQQDDPLSNTGPRLRGALSG